MKVSELKKEYERLKAEELQREREKNRTFKIFQDLENWVRIVECKGGEFTVIKDFEFEWYNLYWQAIFNEVAQYTK